VKRVLACIFEAMSDDPDFESPIVDSTTGSHPVASTRTQRGLAPIVKPKLGVVAVEETVSGFEKNTPSTAPCRRLAGRGICGEERANSVLKL
jgi:hypothetical protein